MNKWQKGLQKYGPTVLIITYMGLLIYQHQFIHMYGDDYYYGTFVRDGFINQHRIHYKFINGRALVHVIVSLLLVFKTHLFTMINPMMILGTLILLAKTITQKKEDYIYVLAMNVALFSMLSINITRQSVYWLDGSFNYLFPMFMAIASLYSFRKSIQEDRCLWYVPLLGLVAGMTVEQASAITVGGLLLIIIYEKLIARRRLHWSHYLTFILAMIGSLSIILAPGTSSRIEVEAGVNIIENLQKVIGVLFLYKDVQVYNLLLLGGLLLWLSQLPKTLFRRILSFLNGLILVLYIGTGTNYTQFIPLNREDNRVLFLCAVMIGVFLLTFLYVAIYQLKAGQPMMLLALVLAMGSQVMMILSPIYEYRNLLSALLLYMIPIGLTVSRFKKMPYMWLGMAFAFSYYMGWERLSGLVIIGTFIYLICQRFDFDQRLREMVKIIAILVVMLASLAMTWQNIEGYKANHQVNVDNEAKIKAYLQGEIKTTPLVLKEMPQYDYGWSYPYINPYHMLVMKQYYGIDEQVEIIYQP